jgi:hypothetical protein
MSLETTTREKARGWGWLLATGIAAAAGAIFAAAIVLGGPAASDAAEVRPDVPQFPKRELPKEWRWERKAISFDHMFRHYPK